MCEDVMLNDLEEDTALEYLCVASNNNAFNTKIKIIKWISSRIEKYFERSDFQTFAITNPALFFEIMKENHK